MRRLIYDLSMGLVLIALLILTTLATRWAITSAAEAAPSSSTVIASLTTPVSTSNAPSFVVTPGRQPTVTPVVTPTPYSPPSSATPPPPPSTPTIAPPHPVHVTPVLDVEGIDAAAPTPMPLVEQPEDAINIVLLGADGAGMLTDVIVVVSVNPEGPYVSLLSIPRDLYVWVPTRGFHKINTAYRRGGDYPGGGPALIKATIEHNLGIPIHYYALVNFRGFIQIVDTLSGLEVPVECELHDTFPNPADPEQGIDIDLYPGVQYLDGQHALWYVRSRWSSTDYDRNRRQQQVLRALYRRVLDTGTIPRIPQLWGAMQETVETDLGLDDVIWLGWVGGQLDWVNVKGRFIGPPFVTSGATEGGSYVLQPVPDALPSLIAEALRPPAIGRADQRPFRVEVWDGSGRPGMAAVAAERLRWEGFDVIEAITVEEVYSRTQIVDLTTTSKGSPLPLLLRLYRRSEGDVVYEPTSDRTADFRILLGADYNSCIAANGIQHVPMPTPASISTP